MTLARRVREAVGLSLEAAAKRARISPGYLRRIERYGNAPYSLARRLATLYGCDMVFFLYGDDRTPRPRFAGGNQQISNAQKAQKKRPFSQERA